jgi:3'(2'), 5'-bisphosphate nucleotidase
MDELTKIAAHGAETILDLAMKADVRTKTDGSPVTAADEAADAVIRAGLVRLAPGVPIVSEEQPARDRPKAIEGGSYFLVDPLDGTREFIAGRNEYTINIAVMTDGAPMLGVICAPALGDFWRGIVGKGADWFSTTRWTGGPTAIHTRPRLSGRTVVAVSRSHLDAETQAYVEALGQIELTQCGSSVKFCRLAEGSADLYPRLAPTHDWDVAAGHAIVTAAGGRVGAPDGSPLVYGSPELLIPGFIALGDAGASFTA